MANIVVNVKEYYFSESIIKVILCFSLYLKLDLSTHLLPINNIYLC